MVVLRIVAQACSRDRRPQAAFLGPRASLLAMPVVPGDPMGPFLELPLGGLAEGPRWKK